MAASRILKSIYFTLNYLLYWKYILSDENHECSLFVYNFSEIEKQSPH